MLIYIMFKKEEDDIIKQSYIKASPDILEVDKTEKLVYQMKNSICKLYPGDTKEGTGFFFSQRCKRHCI